LLVAIGLLGAAALYAMSDARLDCIRSGQPIIGHEIGGRPVCLGRASGAGQAKQDPSDR